VDDYLRNVDLHPIKMKHKTREEYLQAAVELSKDLFETAGYKVPPVRVSCGWPVRGGMANKKRVIGECWDKKSSKDTAQPQIFISPWLDDVATDTGVLSTLVHELVHAVVGNKEKHNKVFSKCARAVGLEGKLTCTHASENLVKSLEGWSIRLGDYPHSSLSKLTEPSKKQGTRLLKCECDCGYTIRITQKWLDVGAPDCPACLKTLECKTKTEDEDEDEGE
jgi:hypothetical protein